MSVTELSAEDAALLMAPRCPHSLFSRLHEGPGVYLDPLTGNYVVTRYDLARKIVGNSKDFSSNTGLTIERDTPIKHRVREMYETRAWPVKHVLLTNDPPEHKMFRALVDKVWSPARVNSLLPYMCALIEASIDAFIDRGEVEFISEFAETFPVIIASDFLGLPRTDKEQILAWTRAAVSIIDNRYDEKRELAAHEQIINMLNYIADARKAAPDDGESFLSALKTVEIDGRRLTEQEFVWLVELLLVGGHDSITLGIGSAMLTLVEHPELEGELRADPAKLDNFVEELLRTFGPVKVSYRRALAPVTIDGIDIPEGALLQLQWSAANLDPTRFENPDKFDISRANANRHTSFGSGVHLCIGNQLARAEIKHGLELLLRRTGNFRLLGDVTYRTDYVQQGPTAMRIGFDKIDAAA